MQQGVAVGQGRTRWAVSVLLLPGAASTSVRMRAGGAVVDLEDVVPSVGAATLPESCRRRPRSLDAGVISPVVEVDEGW